MKDDNELHVISVLDHLASLQSAIGESLLRIAQLAACESAHGETEIRRYRHDIWVSAWIDAHHVDGRDIVYWLDVVWKGPTWHLIQRVSIQGDRNIWEPDEIVRTSFEEIAKQAIVAIVEGLGVFEATFR